jgi:AraC-like DNA-binding protein
MFYRRHIPPQPLAAFVSCLWYSEGFEGTHQQERLLPNGESGIVIDLREGPVRIYEADDPRRFKSFAPAVFCGARTDCFVIDTSQQERVIGIQFNPGGAFPFLDMPASELAHGAFALDDIWPRSASLLREQLMSARSADAMFIILEHQLLSRLAQHLHPAIAFAAKVLARPSGDLQVRTVADRVGFSSRRFIELFRQQTGLAPKAFQRVRRFQHVLQTLHRGQQDDWAGLALRCGYYDQAHFIHDFRLFSGMTPSAYVAAATPHLNHVPIR